LCDAGGVVSQVREWPEEAGNIEALSGRHGGLGRTPWWRCFDTIMEQAQHGGGVTLTTSRTRRKNHRQRSSMVHGTVG
jgi:hypothetical protein